MTFRTQRVVKILIGGRFVLMWVPLSNDEVYRRAKMHPKASRIEQKVILDQTRYSGSNGAIIIPIWGMFTKIIG